MEKNEYKEQQSLDEYLWEGYSKFNAKPFEEMDDHERIRGHINSIVFDVISSEGHVYYKKFIQIINEHFSTMCKTQVIEDAENSRTAKIMNQLFNDVIYNKSKRQQLFFYYTKSISNERYVVHEPFEIIITSEDYNISKLNSLYHKAVQKYYTTMIPFDNVELNLSIDNTIVITAKSECDINRPITYTLHSTLGLPKKNRNNNTELLVKSFTEMQYQKLCFNVMKYNIRIPTCNIIEPRKYTGKVKDIKGKMGSTKVELE